MSLVPLFNVQTTTYNTPAAVRIMELEIYISYRNLIIFLFFLRDTLDIMKGKGFGKGRLLLQDLLAVKGQAKRKRIEKHRSKTEEI